MAAMAPPSVHSQGLEPRLSSCCSWRRTLVAIAVPSVAASVLLRWRSLVDLGEDWDASSAPTALILSGWPGRQLGEDVSCEDVQEEMRGCENPACMKSPAVAKDCMWAQWSQWTSCQCGGTQSRSRIVKVQGQTGGLLCSGPKSQVQPCNEPCPEEQIVDCILAIWSDWSACTHSCEGGQTYRNREILRQPRNGGALCTDFLHETRVCNAKQCPGNFMVDCHWGDWTTWTSCSVTCGSGEKRRSRSVKYAPQAGGRLCEPVHSAEVARCGGPCLASAQSCQWSTWTPWSTCSKTCGDGQQFRVRSIAREATDGGTPCTGLFEDYEDCAWIPCSAGGLDCQFTHWSAWSVCSGACNGHHSRARSVAKYAEKGGRPCKGSTMDISSCNLHSPACAQDNIDCVLSEWEIWSGCSRSCSGGMTERKRSILVHAAGSGTPCEGKLQEVKACNLDPCIGESPVDCLYSEWSMWSACTVTCGGGQHRRHRTIIVEAKSGGKPCDPGASIEVDECHTEMCIKRKEVCDWTQWSDWSGCERAGEIVGCGGGQQKRSRTTVFIRRPVFVPPGGFARRLAGKPSDCNDIQESLRACADTPCDEQEPADCAWGLWSEWSPCPCNGIRERHRVIASFALPPGSPCEGPEVQAQACESHCQEGVPLDCTYSSWSHWSACPVTCGGREQGGILRRFRTIVQYPRGVGKECSESRSQHHSCNDVPCPERRDCLWGDWSEYSPCSITCGGGQKTRVRTVAQVAEHGGAPCQAKDSMSVDACDTQPCPSNARECEFSVWNDWEACSLTCGRGMQLRSRVIMVDVTEDGRACDGRLQQFRDCNTQTCVHAQPVACEWTLWGEWSACSAPCNGHQDRDRAIERFAANGGPACVGSEREIKACNLHSQACAESSPQDCVLGTWSAWTHCTQQCDGGQHFRSRLVKVSAQNFGRPCKGSLQQSRGCNTEPCSREEKVNCMFAAWTEWSACTRPCSGGQRTRHRGIYSEARGGGNPCAPDASMQIQACNVQTCANALEVCGWGEWSQWDSCSKTCGSGQQQRLRQRTWLAPEVLKTKGASSAGAVAGPTGVSPFSRRLQDFGPPRPGGPDDCRGSQRAIRPCGLGSCNYGGPAPVPCKWAAWTAWGSCTCEGLEERERDVAVRPQNGGTVCEGPSRETRKCKPHCAHQSVDCDFSEWSDWGRCSTTCGGGQQYHLRTIRRHARAHGMACHGELEAVRSCSNQPCSLPQPCQYGEWTEWTACSRSCDGGQTSRTRDIAFYPSGGGTPCRKADLMEVGGCGTGSCNPFSATDCKWSVWSTWSKCSAECGLGWRSRNRQVAVEARHSGTPCSGVYAEYKKCQKAQCGPDPVDCKLWGWSDWSRCFDKCGGTQERARSVHIFNSHGGHPCSGALRQVRACLDQKGASCSVIEGNVDCILSAWSQWSDCSASCGGGQQLRNRHVVQQAHGAGERCIGDMRVAQTCNTGRCPGTEPVDCLWGDWSHFSVCTASCGGGQMARHRGIEKEARFGGRQCALTDTMEQVPCNRQLCRKSVYCAWAPWNTWESCSSTCGRGEKKRSRKLVRKLRRPGAPGASRLNEMLPLHADDTKDSALTAFVFRHEPEVFVLAFIGLGSLLVLGICQAAKSVQRAASNQARAYLLVGAGADPATVGQEDLELPPFEVAE